MKKLFFLIVLSLAMVACGKTGPTGPIGPEGPTGPTGPTGPGYSEVSITSSRDNTVGSSISNNGSYPSIAVGKSPSDIYRELFYFDVSQANLPSNAMVVNAILTLYPSGGDIKGNIITCKIYPLTRDWSESDSTWLAATGTTNWSTPGGDYIDGNEIGGFSVDVGTTSKIEVELDLTTVRNWINGQFNYGFVIKSIQESGPEAYFAVYSNNYSIDPSKRPSLKMIYK